MTLVERLTEVIDNTTSYIDQFEEEARKASIVPQTLDDLKTLMKYSLGILSIEVETISMHNLDQSIADASHFLTDDFFYV